MLLNASGCLDALIAPDVARGLDAFVTKTVTPLPRDGNTPVRIAETDVGMLNSIGLANPGIDRFLTRNLRELGELGVPVWVSVGGFETDDYAEICSRLDDHAEVSAIELNVSCPNVDAPAESAAQIVSASRLATRKPLWASSHGRARHCRGCTRRAGGWRRRPLACEHDPRTETRQKNAPPCARPRARRPIRSRR